MRKRRAVPSFLIPLGGGAGMSAAWGRFKLAALMQHLLIVYVHLVATCMAIGVIVMTDMRLLAKLAGYRVVIPPPERFETRMIVVALATLLVSGAALIGLGLAADPHYLANPKLQAKLLLVAALWLNALALHRITFPRLARVRPVASWSARDHWSVALPVGVSNSLWMYCAFLGVARIWNYRVPLWQVLAVACVLIAGAVAGVRFALHFAARDEAELQPDWIDTVKTRLSDRRTVERQRHPFEQSQYQQRLF